MTVTQYYHFTTDGSFKVLGNLQEAIASMTEPGFIWFKFYKPLREELNSLVDSVGIHPLSVEDCFDENQVPKIEYFQDNTFIIFNSFTYSDKELFIDEVNLFIGKRFLITVSGNHSGNREPLSGITGILEKGQLKFHGGPDFLMHIVLDYIVDQKYKSLDELEDELEQG